jgi:hypothetical protein
MKEPQGSQIKIIQEVDKKRNKSLKTTLAQKKFYSPNTKIQDPKAR